MRRWVIALGLAGCYNASFDQNVPCSPALTCPGDQVCDTTHSPPVCVGQLGSGSNELDSGAADAPISACGVCPSAMPVCDSTATTCRGCNSDSECDSHVCSESTGLCLTEARTLYVRTTGNDVNPCTHDLPCANVSRAVQLLDATHNVIRIYDGDYNDNVLTANASFLLSGEGNNNSNATIHYKPGGGGNHDHALEVDGGTVVVEGVSFDGGMAETIRAQGGATLSLFSCEVFNSPIGSVDAMSSTVNLYDTMIHDGQGTEAAVNVTNGTLVMQRGLMYTLGGACIRVNGAKYDIENSILAGCAAEGFAQLGAAQNIAIFSFNTVASNLVGVTCVSNVTVKNSIFANNTNTPQVPACAAATYSLFSDPLVPGGIGNLGGDPSFVASDDLHINFNSPARDKADPNATTTFDFDGEPRPHGSGFDIGADEHY